MLNATACFLCLFCCSGLPSLSIEFGYSLTFEALALETLGTNTWHGHATGLEVTVRDLQPISSILAWSRNAGPAIWDVAFLCRSRRRRTGSERNPT